MPNKNDLVTPMLHRLARLGILIPKSSIEDFLTRQAKLLVLGLRQRMHPEQNLEEYVEALKPSYVSLEICEKTKPLLDYEAGQYAPSVHHYVQKKDWNMFLESARVDILSYIHSQPHSSTIRFLNVKIKKEGDKVLWKISSVNSSKKKSP